MNCDRPVASISVGLISDYGTGEQKTFTDFQGVEDFHGEMGFRVASTTRGITSIQMDLRNKGLTMVTEINYERGNVLT